MPKRNLPHWLLCLEKLEPVGKTPITLYKQCWLRLCETGQLYSIHWWNYRFQFPKFQVEYLTTRCTLPNCDLYLEPHYHLTDNHDALFYSRAGCKYYDLVQFPEDY